MVNGAYGAPPYIIFSHRRRGRPPSPVTANGVEISNIVTFTSGSAEKPVSLVAPVLGIASGQSGFFQFTSCYAIASRKNDSSLHSKSVGTCQPFGANLPVFTQNQLYNGPYVALATESLLYQQYPDLKGNLSRVRPR